MTPKTEKIKGSPNFMKIGTRPILTMANSKMRSNFQNSDILGFKKGIKKGLKRPKIEKIKGCPNFMKIVTRHNSNMANSKMRSILQNFDPLGVKKGIKRDLKVPFWSRNRPKIKVLQIS